MQRRVRFDRWSLRLWKDHDSATDRASGRSRQQGESRCATCLRTAYAFQEPNLLPWCSVIDNIRLPLELLGVPRPDQQPSIEDSLRLIGLQTADYRKYPRMLSGGMKMGVSLARAMVTKPGILLLDEPFASLDDMLRQQLNEDLLAELAGPAMDGAVCDPQRRGGGVSEPACADHECPSGEDHRVRGRAVCLSAAAVLRGQGELHSWQMISAGGSEGDRGGRNFLLQHVLPPLLLLILVVVAWQVIVTVWGLPPYLLPGPSDVCAVPWRRGGATWRPRPA